MRGPIMVMLAIVILVSVIVPIQGSEADTPTRLYFFNADNECIAEVILIPGEPLQTEDIPACKVGYAWYDDNANIVHYGSTFGSGDYIIRAYDHNNPPSPPERDYTIIAIAGTAIVVSLIALAAYLLIFKKK